MTSTKFRQLIAVIVILATGLVISAFLIQNEETSQEKGGQIKSPLSVDVFKTRKSDVRLSIPAWGLVQPCERINVKTQVEGRISHVPDRIIAGASVRQGDLLLKIEQDDYQFALIEARGVYEKSLQALSIERGQQEIAMAEFKLFEKKFNVNTIEKKLALREPQRKSLEAESQIAAAKMGQAKLNLARTRVKSPCNGKIISEDLAVGKLMNKGSVALTLACTGKFHIIAGFLPKYVLDSNSKDAQVVINGIVHPGEIKNVLPQIDPETRQKQVLIAIKSKVATIGDYASVKLQGRLYKDVISLPKEALRAGDTLWIMEEDNTLSVRKVFIAGQDDDLIIVTNGVLSNEKVILSHISSPLEGMRLQEKRQVFRD